MTELLEAALTDYDVTAIDERSPENWRVFFADVHDRDNAASALRAAFPGLTVEAIDVEDEDWAARSQSSLRAVRVGDIVVAPPWDVPADADLPPLTIVIQPSMGFGTGHHATTRLCLAALQRIDLRTRSVIDVGTGSGVLAIAASLLGAGQAIGIDDDQDAIAAARENVALNPRARVTLLNGDLRSVDLPPADVVVANLTGALLETAAPWLLRLSSNGGRLVISGLLTTEEQAILTAYSSRTVEHRATEDEWVCMTWAPTRIRIARPPSPTAPTAS